MSISKKAKKEFSNDKNFYTETLTDVTVDKSGYILGFNGTCFLCPNDCKQKYVPKIGDMVKIYGKYHGHPIRGASIFKDDVDYVFFYNTQEEADNADKKHWDNYFKID